MRVGTALVGSIPQSVASTVTVTIEQVELAKADIRRDCELTLSRSGSSWLGGGGNRSRCDHRGGGDGSSD